MMSLQIQHNGYTNTIVMPAYLSENNSIRPMVKLVQ